MFYLHRERAFFTLQEAIKFDYENWRMWENYLCLAADIGEFQEAIRSVHRILDLREKFSDVPVCLIFDCKLFSSNSVSALQVLKVLVKAVTENLPDRSNSPSSKLAPELKKLFGRVSSKVQLTASFSSLCSNSCNFCR
jgi:hypothetical protein